MSLRRVYICCSITTSCLWPQPRAGLRYQRSPLWFCGLFVLNCQAADHMVRLLCCWQSRDVTCLSVSTADTNKQASDTMMKFWCLRPCPREITMSHGILCIFKWTSATHFVAVECLCTTKDRSDYHDHSNVWWTCMCGSIRGCSVLHLCICLHFYI